MHIEELTRIADRLEKAGNLIQDPFAKDSLGRVEASIRRAEVAWSGSWLGYHARVYHNELTEPPAGSKFSREWGLLSGEGVTGTASSGDWCKYRNEDVIRTIWQNAGNPNLLTVRQASQAATETFLSAKEELQPLVASIMARHGKQDILTGLASRIGEMDLFKAEDFLRKWHPKSPPSSRDEIAMTEGVKVPPHLQVKAEIWAIRHPFMLCGELAKTIRWLADQLVLLNKQAEAARRQESATTAAAASADATPATVVCIGHGNSEDWRQVRDQLLGTTNLACEEFNHLPVAGLANVERLSQLLRQTRFVILVHTMEDESPSGPPQAALNVAHTAGLFQGRLGFRKAVVLAEEGCGEIALVKGLPRIPFPKGRILEACNELRALLRQENILSS